MKTLALCLGVMLAGCMATGSNKMVGGDVRRGASLVSWYGCGTCHTIPSVAEATGKVGPPLKSIAQRSYLAGRLPNTPENMINWIREPRTHDPQTAMPNMHVDEHDARDIAEFLYTLR